MDKETFEANRRLEEKMYPYALEIFNERENKEELKKTYKKHNLRMSLLMVRDLAKENNELKHLEFVNSVLEEINNQIISLNNSYKNNTIDEELKKYPFGEKVNIYFYIRNDFYDPKYDPYEILNDDTKKILGESIIKEANEILKDYKITLEDVINMPVMDFHDLIGNKDLSLDILYSTEIIKNKMR